MNIENIDSAFPFVFEHIEKGSKIVQVFPGISKRLYIATMAMQGLIQAGFISANSNAKQAFIMADHLLEKESYTDEQLREIKE